MDDAALSSPAPRPLFSNNDIVNQTVPSPQDVKVDGSTDEKKAELANKNGDTIIDLGEAHHDDRLVESQPKQKASEGFLKDFKRLLSYATKFDWILIFLGVVSSAGTGIAFPLMEMIVFGRLSVNFTDYFIPGSGVTKGEFLSQVNHNVLYVVYLFIGRFVLDYVSIFAFRMVGIRISASIRLAYLSSLFGQPVSVVDKLPSGSATDSLTTAANTIQLGISDKLGLLIQNLVLLIAAYVIAFKYSWKLTLASTSCIFFILLVYGAIVPFWLKLYKAVLKDNAGAAGISGEALRSIRTVKALCAEDALIKKHAEMISRARKKGVQMSPLTAAQFAPGMSLQIRPW